MSVNMIASILINVWVTPDIHWGLSLLLMQETSKRMNLEVWGGLESKNDQTQLTTDTTLNMDYEHIYIYIYIYIYLYMYTYNYIFPLRFEKFATQPVILQEVVKPIKKLRL